MMFLVLTLIMILQILKPKSKWVFVLSFLLLWILFGWSKGLADEGIYITRYTLFDETANRTEPIFTLIMRFFNNLKFDYIFFHIVLSGIILLLFEIFIYKNTKYINSTLLLYIIYPFCMDVCQIRFTMAIAIMCIAFQTLLNENHNNKKNLVIYSVITVIAGLIHYAAFLYLLLLLTKIKKKEIFYLILIIIGLLELILISVFNYTGYIGNDIFMNKFDFVINSQNYNLQIKIMNIIFIICTIIFYLILNKIVFKKLYRYNNNNKYEKELKKIETVKKINIIMFLILPIMWIITDVYRIQTGLNILNYITLSYYFLPDEDIKKNKNNTVLKQSLIFGVIIIGFSLLQLWYFILRNPNINTTLIPLLKNNSLL